MADVTPVTEAAVAYGDDRVEEAIAPLNARIAELEEELAECQDTDPPDPPDPGERLIIIGMSSPADLWDERLEEVGPEGITARRIFAQLNSSGSDQMDLVADAVEAGQAVVFSFKVPSVANAIKGQYDEWVRSMCTKLDEFGEVSTVTFWHEPYGDMSGADHVKVWERYLPIIQDHEFLKAGPILNGWLLDRKVPDFTSYTNAALREAWDFIGIDTYEEGDISTEPGDILPGDRVPKLEKWLQDNGIGDKPVVYGEYNGYSANSITKAGEAFLASPNTWAALMWNSTEGKGYALTGDRLEAFKNTKADSRVKQ